MESLILKMGQWTNLKIKNRDKYFQMYQLDLWLESTFMGTVGMWSQEASVMADKEISLRISNKIVASFYWVSRTNPLNVWPRHCSALSFRHIIAKQLSSLIREYLVLLEKTDKKNDKLFKKQYVLSTIQLEQVLKSFWSFLLSV